MLQNANILIKLNGDASTSNGFVLVNFCPMIFSKIYVKLTGYLSMWQNFIQTEAQK